MFLIKKKKNIELYFIRHGQTNYNVKGIVQGHIDSYLTEQGKTQAKRLSEKIEINENDLILSSDLLRCKQTSNILFGSEKEIHYTELLRERHMGIYQGLPNNDLSDTLVDKEIIKDGESLEDLSIRIDYFLKLILDKISERKEIERIYIVTHSTFILYFNKKILGYVPNEIPKNCSICSYLAKINEIQFNEIQFGEINLINWNNYKF